MKETEKGYRGSKSIVSSTLYLCVGKNNAVVKEQRVDGSLQGYIITTSCVRYTLTGFERNYLIKTPFSQINKSIRKYTSLANPTHNLANKINPLFLTGFSDGESGCPCGTAQSNTLKTG